MFAKIYFEITNICNLSCSFCPSVNRKKCFVTVDDFSIIAKKIRPYTKYLYLHLMGEPLMHPKLDQILTAAGKLGFRIIITTNGTLLDSRGDILLLHADDIHKISISLHSFEANNLPLSFENYLNNCFSFSKLSSERGIITALRLWNLDGNNTKGQNSKNADILSIMHDSFPDEWKKNRSGYKIGERLYLEWGEKFDWPDINSPTENTSCFCYGLRDHVGILCDGTVVPCCLDYDGSIPLGNLFLQDFEEIIFSKRARAVYDGFSQRRAAEPLCRHCGYAQRFSIR